MPTFVLSLFLTAFALMAPALYAAEFNYPDISPFLATIGGTPESLRAPIPAEPDIQQEDLQIRVLPNRKLPPAFRQYSKLGFRVAWHDEPAPLVFLIAGSGSGYDSARMDHLKALYWQAGMHVIVMSSPTNFDFIAAASNSGLPGLGQRDARDLHTAMSLAVERARNVTGLEATEFRMVGFSLGAMNAAFVSELDEHLGQFNFTKVLMLNPPVNLYDSVRRLDALSFTHVPGVDGTESFYEHIFDKISRYFAQTGDTDIESTLFSGIQTSDEALSDDELAMLIGAVFRFAAADLNFMADLINDTGRYAPTGQTITVSTSLTPYLRRALFCDFGCYIRNQLWPDWHSLNAEKTIEDMAYETSLQSIEEHIAGNPRIAVLTNADDFILTRADYHYLAETFGERAFLYPRGGHGGNLEHQQVTARMLSFLQGATP
ncbi:MAG: hypothetical protein ACJAXR_002335 [Halopseudomonas sp.]|jgi:hypothetical protein|uniref:serine/threonine protein kinase n=1 Tax=Halopseudomonas sp. TaxID=2901191 RepID=UPI0039E5D015